MCGETPLPALLRYRMRLPLFRSLAVASWRKLRPTVPIAITTIIVLATMATVGSLLFRQGQGLLKQQLKDRLRDAAAAAAMQFDAASISAIQRGDTLETSPQLRDTVSRLDRLRKEIQHVRFAYIMRRTEDPEMLAFVADADLALPASEIDRDGDGHIDLHEQPSRPGDPYSVVLFPALRSEAFLGPTADQDIGVDQWGPVISGYAPIIDAAGLPVAVLGIDMSASDYLGLSQNLFSPVVLVLLIVSMLSIGSATALFLMRRRMEMLRRLEVERSGLLRLAFHQLGGPLTIIRWSLEELQEVGSPEDRRTIANIQEGLKRLMAILKTLKDADQVHTGRLTSTPEIVALSSVLELVEKQAGSRLSVRRQSVRLNLDASLQISMERSLANGVFEELLTNASDYSPEGSQIQIVSRRVGHMAEVRVIDVGHGIPKKDMPRIFGEFIRGSNATQYKADGNGLGLYIVKGIVEHAGGTIGIESAEGKGTTVTVRLPLAS